MSRACLDAEIRRTSHLVAYSHLQPLGTDEIHIRPTLNKLVQTDGELVVDSTLCAILTFIKYRHIILEDRLIPDRKAIIDNILLTRSSANIGILFYETDNYKKVTLRLTDPVLTSSHTRLLALLASGLGIQRICHCTLCIIWLAYSIRLGWQEGLNVQCPFPSCSEDVYTKDHLESHFLRSGMYHCDDQSCTQKCKRWADLKRHILTHHCLEANKFPCGFPGCERGGENGFTRKDKMNEHVKNVHQGVGIPPKNPRRLAPKN